MSKKLSTLLLLQYSYQVLAFLQLATYGLWLVTALSSARPRDTYSESGCQWEGPTAGSKYKKMYHINARPTARKQGVERGASPRSRPSSNPALAAVCPRVNFYIPTGDVELSTQASNLGLARFTNALSTAHPPPLLLLYPPTSGHARHNLSLSLLATEHM